MSQPWKHLSSEHIGNFRIFNLRSDRKLSPRTGLAHDFYVIEAVNWVNVIAITTGGQLVMIDQFRHGSNTTEVEVPGGMIDKEDVDPVMAAVRELREETGYEGASAVLIGRIYPNPAIMNNCCYTVLIEGCELKHPVELDAGEDLVTRLVDECEIPELICAGQIGHALVVVALQFYQLWKTGGQRTIR
ncbi:MAG: NUDIX hydrolase [Pedosphaera sp.]|nr:NUDIX hydrolase [Pedosphaera sp.]